MKNTLNTLLLVLLTFVLATPALAQTATTRTNLTVALAAGARNATLTVVSTTGITASTASQQTFLFLAGPGGIEQMQVTAVNSTASTITVRRAVRGLATAHAIRTPVWFGGAASFDVATGNVAGSGATPTVGGSIVPPVFVGLTPLGVCTRANNSHLPVINPNTGEIVDCILGPSAATGVTTANTTSLWTIVNARATGLSVPYKKLRPETTTYTFLESDYIVGYNTNVAGTITIPALTGAIGKQYILQIEVTGNQSVTVATSAGQTINGQNNLIFGGQISGLVGNASMPFQRLTIYYDGDTRWFAGIP